MPGQFFMNQTMRWYGPADVVSLADIRQAGCTGVVTALHQIPVGEIWSRAAIQERKSVIEAAGMAWKVVESLPVHEDIKKGKSQRDLWIKNYAESLVNLAAEGIEVVTYNFMPVLDWLRTNIAYELPDGSKALYFDRLAFVVFDLFLLQRPGAEKEYTSAEIAAAQKQFNSNDAETNATLFRNCMMGLPGSKISFTRQQVLEALQGYAGISAKQLKENLFYFLGQVVPVAAAHGLKLAIHPDDPPFSVLGLPRIMSTAADVTDLVNAVPDHANGLCFCTGSFGARKDNKLVEMLQAFADRVHFLHLRNTNMEMNGNFYEADHLAGDADMYSIVATVWEIMQRRQYSIPMRPDHGHQMLDDLKKETFPGYSAIGRLKGLAEIRGVEYAVSRFSQA